MRAISLHPRLAVLLLMPLLATCTAAPGPQARSNESFSAPSEDERLVALLIDGKVVDAR
jgi:hypothetical protein